SARTPGPRSVSACPGVAAVPETRRHRFEQERARVEPASVAASGVAANCFAVKVAGTVITADRGGPPKYDDNCAGVNDTSAPPEPATAAARPPPRPTPAR